MPSSRRYARLALALGFASATAMTARTASAQPACGAGFLGLEEGVTWRYERTIPEGGDQPESAASDLVLELPTEHSVTVDSISTDEGTTVVELVERYGDIEQTTQVRCAEDEELEVSPHSFLASGEPGGGIGIALDETDREGKSYPRALKNGLRWTEWIEADVEMSSAEDSGATHAAGKVQVERTMSVIRRVRLEIDETSYRPYRVDYTLSGRGMVEPEIDLGVEIPADAAGALWFEPGVGLVRAVNRFGHDWKLAERTTGDDGAGDEGEE